MSLVNPLAKCDPKLSDATSPVPHSYEVIKVRRPAFLLPDEDYVRKVCTECGRDAVWIVERSRPAKAT